MSAPDCSHPELRMSAEGVFCTDPECGARIDDDMAPLPADPNANLRTVHEIDQAHASALQRVDSLMQLFDIWQKQSVNQAAMEATDNPMVFYTLVQVGRTRIDVDEFPYILAVCLMKLAKSVVKP